MEIKAQQQALGFLMASSRCLNTRNILRIRTTVSMDMTIIKWVLCHTNMEETVLHLFFGCQFSKACWHWVGLTWIMPLPFFSMMTQAGKKYLQLPFFIHGDFFIIVAWKIWKQRSGVNFFTRDPTYLLTWLSFLIVSLCPGLLSFLLTF